MRRCDDLRLAIAHGRGRRTLSHVLHGVAESGNGTEMVPDNVVSKGRQVGVFKGW
jgi:hypothetical protein